MIPQQEQSYNLDSSLVSVGFLQAVQKRIEDPLLIASLIKMLREQKLVVHEGTDDARFELETWQGIKLELKLHDDDLRLGWWLRCLVDAATHGMSSE